MGRIPKFSLHFYSIFSPSAHGGMQGTKQYKILERAFILPFVQKS